MVEARGAKAVPQVGRERLLVAEDDAFDDSAPLAVQPACGRSRERGAQPVGDAPEAAAMAGERPPVGAEDDVDALVPEPGALVEAVRGRPRQANRGDRLEQGALRRRAAERQLEENRLVEAEEPEPRHLCREPHLEWAEPRRPGHHEVGALGSANSRQ